MEENKPTTYTLYREVLTETKAEVCGKSYALKQYREPLPLHLLKLVGSATPYMGGFDVTMFQERCESSYRQKEQRKLILYAREWISLNEAGHCTKAGNENTSFKKPDLKCLLSSHASISCIYCILLTIN